MRLAVVDVETTGFSRCDRIVEFACVSVVDGVVVDEYDTLIDPERDPGPVAVHGITVAMLENAPTFAEVLGEIAARLDGAVLAAHSIAFDVRMLRQEAARVGGGFDPGYGLCTYQMTRRKLSVAAAEAGLAAPDHSALVDARATAALVGLHATEDMLVDVRAASWRPGPTRCPDRPARCRVRRAGLRSAVSAPRTVGC